jgi:glycosyltransferase involved in cell wall biosynthesis
MKIILFCQSLVVGGTQRQIALLAPSLKRRGHDVSVAVFYRGGPFDGALVEAGIPIHDLRKKGRWDVIGLFRQLTGVLKRERPDVLYAFLPVPNVAAAIAKFLIRPAPRVVFGVRSSRMHGAHYDWLTRRQYAIEAAVSRWADLVIVNSRDGREDITRRGFRAPRIAVIPNGIDTDAFAPDPSGRARLRAEWGVHDSEVLVGQVARFDPMKGHHFFFAAAAQLKRDQSWRFVCIGVDEAKMSNARALAQQFGIEKCIILVGPRNDMRACFSALDIACQASRFGEGFPNVVAEAMACGIPSVVTDVGDAPAIVGGLGEVVTPGDANALAEGLIELRRRVESGSISVSALRAAIVDRFGVATIAAATEHALQSADV